MNSKLKKFLPLGTVVTLQGATKRLMIIGYCISPKTNPDEIYDYSGCVYPEGTVFDSQVALFNHNQIEKVDYMGPIDEEQKQFVTALEESLNNPEIKEVAKELAEHKEELSIFE